MAIKNLITTSGIQEIKTAEGELANNLFIHANSTLSKAHGWELINLPHPFLVDGNDVSFYADSHGDVVGTTLLRLTHNNVNYFAPLNSSTLAGQPASTGVLLTSRGQIMTQGNAAWITNFSSQYEQNLITTNNSVLLPHTRLGHWQAHTADIYSVVPLVVRDSAGHVVSNYVAKISYAGQQLWIPCEPRLGGPLQPIRLPRLAITTYPGFNFNIAEMSADDDQFGRFWYNAPTGGTLPYTVKWQFNTYQPQEAGASGYFWTDPNIGSGTWIDLPYTTTALAIPAGNPEPGIYAMTPPNMLTLQVGAGSNDMRVAATIRAIYTNAAGSQQSNWCLFLCKDKDGSWVISDPGLNQTAYYVPFTNDPVWTDGYYV